MALLVIPGALRIHVNRLEQQFLRKGVLSIFLCLIELLHSWRGIVSLVEDIDLTFDLVLVARTTVLGLVLLLLQVLVLLDEFFDFLLLLRLLHLVHLLYFVFEFFELLFVNRIENVGGQSLPGIFALLEVTFTDTITIVDMHR